MTNKKHHLLLLLICTMLCVPSLQAQKLSDDVNLSSGEMLAELQEENVSTIHKWDYFMYPVPASTELNIKITKGEVSIATVIITNESGDEVMFLEDQDVERLRLDIGDFKPGQYYIRIVSDAYSTPKMKRFYVSK